MVDPSVEREFEQAQAEGRARERKKTFYRFTSVTSGAFVFFAIFVPLVMAETAVLEAVPALQALGRLLLLVWVVIAMVPARVVYGFAGGGQLAKIKAWERARDDW